MFTSLIVVMRISQAMIKYEITTLILPHYSSVCDISFTIHNETKSIIIHTYYDDCIRLTEIDPCISETLPVIILNVTVTVY